MGTPNSPELEHYILDVIFNFNPIYFSRGNPKEQSKPVLWR
jgi:hypothetical protein